MGDVKNSSDVHAELARLVTLTNRVALKFNGSRSTCILTSFALNDVLRRLGYNSRLLRIEAAVFPDDPKLVGTILGWNRPPGRRRAARPGNWWGHLAVVVDDEWLLDRHARPGQQEGMAAIDARRPARSPALGEILGRVQVNKCSVRFSPHPRQNGFANAGDARPSHWKPLADRIFEAVQAMRTEGELMNPREAEVSKGKPPCH